MLASHPVTYIYDGSYEGLLCCVFETYMAREMPVAVLSPEAEEMSLFGSKEIVTDELKATRVKKGMQEKLGAEVAELVRLSYFTCLPEKELWVINFLHLAFKVGKRVTHLVAEPSVDKLTKAVQSMMGEAHLLKGFVRFSVQSGVLVSTIGPKNYVLPFLASHFRARYPAEHFLIYDERHHMALVSRPREYAIVPMEEFAAAPSDAEEARCRQLWRAFYDAIEIKARHNELCRMTHLPQRYWKYMTEFAQDDHNVKLQCIQ